jgi:uncharacterized protein
MAVSALAVKFAEACKKRGLKVDVELVEVGALLHDIGRSKTHDVNHSVVRGNSSVPELAGIYYIHY